MQTLKELTVATAGALLFIMALISVLFIFTPADTF